MTETNTTNQFKSFCRKYFNPKVNEYFKNTLSGNWEFIKNDDKAIIKKLCTHDKNDNLALTIARVQLFKLFVEGLFDDFMVGYPLSQLGNVTRYENQIIFHYSESQIHANDNNRRPVRKQISFRLRQDIKSQAEVDSLAFQIKNKINNDSNFTQWNCGEKLYTYKDLDKGYNFRIYALNEVNAKKVIKALYSIQDEDTPDWKNKLVTHTYSSDKNFSPIGSQIILGEDFGKKQVRPEASVKFRWCELILKDYPTRIVLVSSSQSKSNARVYL